MSGTPHGGGHQGHDHDDEDDDDEDENEGPQNWFTGGERRFVKKSIELSYLIFPAVAYPCRHLTTGKLYLEETW
jgi:hypothetical protein